MADERLELADSTRCYSPASIKYNVTIQALVVIQCSVIDRISDSAEGIFSCPLFGEHKGTDIEMGSCSP
jgi:hypothetical protein